MPKVLYSDANSLGFLPEYADLGDRVVEFECEVLQDGNDEAVLAGSPNYSPGQVGYSYLECVGQTTVAGEAGHGRRCSWRCRRLRCNGPCRWPGNWIGRVYLMRWIA